MDTSQVAQGDWTVEGRLAVPLFIGGIDTLLGAAIGTEQGGSGTVGDPYTWHPLASELGSMTVQQGYPGTAGVVHPGDFTGVKANSWSIGVQASRAATLDLDLVGSGFDDQQSLATASFARPGFYTFAHAVAQVGGTARKVTAATISGNNNLTGDNRRFLGSRFIAEPLHGNDLAIRSEFTIEFEDMTDWNAYSAATFDQATVTLVFTSGLDVLSITVKGYVDDSPLPELNGKGPLEYPLNIIGAGDGTDADALTITRSNAA